MNDRVSICICTFKRPALFEVLASLGHLEDLDGYDVDVVIADNDEHDGLRQEVAKFACRFRYEIYYVHAPARNISVARNAAIAGASGRWAAFIDDDEIADGQWLSSLLKCKEGRAAVIGQCIAEYAPDHPSWLRQCDFHSNRIAGNPVNAYTSNALLDLDFIREHAISFRNELGQTGGEDTIFFREIDRSGGKIFYCPDAIVYEPVVTSRANMDWVRRRKFRAGQTHALMCREFEPKAFQNLLFSSGAKALLSFLASVVFIPGTARSKFWQARGMLHLGALAYRVRPKILKEYG